jgi:molybdopterin converting factor small subunit
MATVHIPSLLRDLTGGAGEVDVPLDAGTEIAVDELLRRLDARFPGFSERLLYRGDLMPGLAVFVDGVQGHMKLKEKVGPASQVHFLPPIAGGSKQLAALRR